MSEPRINSAVVYIIIDMSNDLRNLTLDEMSALCENMGEKSYRAKQIFSWLYKGNSSVQAVDEMVNISASLREKLKKAGWDVGVAWQQGAPFHDPWAIRMNFAVPYAYVVKAMDRLKEYVFI